MYFCNNLWLKLRVCVSFVGCQSGRSAIKKFANTIFDVTSPLRNQHFYSEFVFLKNTCMVLANCAREMSIFLASPTYISRGLFYAKCVTL